jgi:hypothetical protein
MIGRCKVAGDVHDVQFFLKHFESMELGAVIKCGGFKAMHVSFDRFKSSAIRLRYRSSIELSDNCKAGLSLY